MRPARLYFVTALLIASGAVSSGCSPTHQDAMTFLKAHEHMATEVSHRLAPADVIAIYSPQAGEVNSTLTVRADGTVRIPLLGNVRVTGLTAREAAAKLMQELSVYYENPKVFVAVESFVSKKYYVYGEIGGGGGGTGGSDRAAMNLPITGRDTIKDILTRFPPTSNAWLSQIRLIRPNPEDPAKPQIVYVDFQKMMTRGDYTQNYLLQEGDVLYVPPTPMAWLGYRVRELIQPVSPIVAAYQAPAEVLGADDVYDDEDDSGDRASSLLGSIELLP